MNIYIYTYNFSVLTVFFKQLTGGWTPSGSPENKYQTGKYDGLVIYQTKLIQ